MILPVHDLLRARLSALLSDHFGIAPADQPSIVIDYPPIARARRSRRAGRVPAGAPPAQGAAAIAQELAGALGAVEGVARVDAAPNGYLNCSSIARRSCSRALAPGAPATRPADDTGKTIVEHTAINPNKAAHIGHLRNAALGDTLVRVLRFRGTPVEVQNYIDDTGVQVADVVVGFRELEQQDARRGPRRSPTRRGSTTTAGTSTRASPSGTTATRSGSRSARATLHDIEHGGNDTAAIGAFIVDRIVRAHLETMARLNIGYDLLTYEGDILRLQFWAHAFEMLKAQGAVFLQTEGKLAGCWVMRIDEDGARRRRTRGRRTDDGDEDEDAREGHRPLERHRHLRRQGHRVPVLEVRPARPRLPLPAVRDAGRRPAAVGDDVSDAGGRAAHPPFGGARTHLQRHRLAADVPAGAAEAGAAHARPRRARPSTRSTSRTRWWRCRTRPRASSATTPPDARTRRSRSSRCRAARASASRSTTCSIC